MLPPLPPRGQISVTVLAGFPTAGISPRFAPSSASALELQLPAPHAADGELSSADAGC